MRVGRVLRALAQPGNLLLLFFFFLFFGGRGALQPLGTLAQPGSLACVGEGGRGDAKKGGALRICMCHVYR